MGRSRLVVTAYVVASLTLPTLGLWVRWFGEQDTSRWAWQMFSTLP